MEGGTLAFLSGMEPKIESQLNEELQRGDGLKYLQVSTIELENFALTVDSFYDGNAAPSTTTIAYFRSNAVSITNTGEI